MAKKSRKRQKAEVKVPLDTKRRREFLFEMYFERRELSKTQRIKEMARLTGLAESGFYRYAKAYQWDTRVIAKAQLAKESDFKKTVYEDAIDKENIAASEVLNTVKDFAFVMLKTSRDMCIAKSTMLKFHAAQMVKIIQDCGGVEYLTVYAKQELKYHSDEVTKIEKQIGDYMRPTSVSKYLSLIGIRDLAAAVPDGIDESAFTVKSVQSMLMGMGLLSTVGNDASVEKIKEDQAKVVEIDARKVKDERNFINTEDTSAVN